MMGKKKRCTNNIKLNIETQWCRFEQCKQKCETKIDSNWYHIEQKIKTQLGHKPSVNENFGKNKFVAVKGAADLFFGDKPKI